MPEQHSKLGASGAERWMECPGSVSLLHLLEVHEETTEPDYRAQGSAAHAAAAWCLTQQLDAWEVIGKDFGPEGQPYPFTDEMAIAVQVYLDECRSYVTAAGQVFVEYRIAEPDIHPDFFGTMDFCVIDGPTMVVVDYKHGSGIPVEVQGNPQVRYYATGMLRHPDAQDVAVVKVVVVQPRIPWHHDGVVRSETVQADELRRWMALELIPAMRRTEETASLLPGKHCCFCPASLICPAVSAAFRSMAMARAGTAGSLADATLGQEYALCQAVKVHIKAVEQETLRRALTGVAFETAKLVNQKANRVWKDGAQDRMVTEFGDLAWSKPDLLSPAQMEKVRPGARDLVHEWAYTPAAGFTLAPRADSRAEVKFQESSEVFATALKKVEEGS